MSTAQDPEEIDSALTEVNLIIPTVLLDFSLKS